MSDTPTTRRETLLMTDGWRFHLGDVDAGAVRGHGATYHTAKAGGGRGAAAPDFDDSAWRETRVPHDWQVEQPFDETLNHDHGFKGRGVAWYRRTFRLDPEDEAKQLSIEFDGVATRCDIWFNGSLLHRNRCGYTPFSIDIDDMAVFGDEPNVLAVRVDADAFEGWWYEGAGVYREARLVKRPAAHVPQYGVFVRPRLVGAEEWDTAVETTVRNAGDEPATCELVSTVLSPDGELVEATSTTHVLPPDGDAVLRQNIHVHAPERWSIDAPRLYVLRTELRTDGAPAEHLETPFGYRTIRFDPDEGFFLNDEPVKLLGTCNHQDHAGVGVSVPDAVQEFRIRRLKEMGSNAYRCAHNPPAPALLDACDRLGMLVMDENRNFGSDPETLEQLRALVLRDRNHPSVVLWSLFNEEPLQRTPRGRKMCERMMRVVRELDPDRPVCGAMNGGFDAGGSIEALDVVGFNYSQSRYDVVHAERPEIRIVGSENDCAFCTRGVYETSDATFYFDSYDTHHATWSTNARESWKNVADRPFVAGIFVWTGFDYRGEPSPHEWPCVNSHWGIMDTCGFPKDVFHLRRALWLEEPVVHILPHWTWPGREGAEIRVMVYTNCEEAELFVNGESLGRKPADIIDQPEWTVPYAPGALRATGYRGGEAAGEATVETTGAPVALELVPDRTRLMGDGLDAVPVTVRAVDGEGRFVPVANDHVRFSVDGPARILGVGNGNPVCHEADVASERSLFNGLAQVIVQSEIGDGELRLRAEADGLAAAEAVLPVERVAVPPRLPVVVRETIVTGWRMSPVRRVKPDPNETVAEHDVNTWEELRIDANLQKAFHDTPGYALYRTDAVVPADFPTTTADLVFDRVVGSVAVYVNGRQHAQRPDHEDGELRARLAVTPGSILHVTVMLYSDTGEGGVAGAVRLAPTE